MRTYWGVQVEKELGCAGVALCIPQLTNNCRCVLSFKLRSLCLASKVFPYPIVFKDATGSEEERTLLSLPALEPRFLCDPPHRLVTLSTAQSKGNKMQIYFEAYPIFQDMILIDHTCYCRYVSSACLCKASTESSY